MRETAYIFTTIGILLCLSLHVYGKTLVVTDRQTTYQLDQYLSIAAPTAAIDSIETLLATSNDHLFLPYQNDPTKYESQRVYWSKFQVENRLSNGFSYPEWVLQLSLIFTDIELYVIDSKGKMQFGRSGFFVPTSQRTYWPIVKSNIVKMTLLPEEKYTVYLKTKCARTAINPTFEIQLSNLIQYQERLQERKGWNATYLGFILMILMYNLVIFFVIKNRSFLFYSIYLMGIVLFVTYNSGDLANWITPYCFPNRPELIYYFKLSAYIALAAYLYFIRFFLNLEEKIPSLNMLFKGLALLAIPAFLLDGFIMSQTNFSYNISDRVLVTFSIIFVLATLTLVHPLVKKTNYQDRFILFGIIAMALGILLTVWARLQSIEYSTFYFRLGSIIEFASFSLALGYNQLQNEKEKQKARFELVKSTLLQEQEHREAQRLAELDTLKSRLYTNITHEFRTPLTVIMGMAEEISGNEKAKELIGRNSENLLQLINQLLDLAKAEDGKLQLQLVEKDIVDYLKYLTEAFLSAAEASGSQLTFYSEEDYLNMAFDEDKIRHIIQNLLSNAIKFTPSNGRIIVHVKQINKQEEIFLQIKVKDNGIGIAKEELPYIFDRFYQADNANSKHIKGTGIGLSLTKELVVLMQGEIVVTSELGKGSTFIIMLPYIVDVAPILSSEPVESISDAIQLTSIVPLGKGTKEADASVDKPILLLIEDNLDVITYIEFCLKKIYTVHTAVDGQKGIDCAFKLIPDIIISDVMMPQKNGFEVTKILKRDIRTSHIPIILLTAKVAQEDKLKGLTHGADAYLIKPFDKEELLIRLEKLIELRSRLQSYYLASNLASNDASIAPVSVSAMSDSEANFLKKIAQFIEEHLEEPDFSIPTIAKMLRMSQIQVYRKIKALTNQTPTQFIRAVRMKHALRLLENTELNISEIAYKTGFSDPNYFSRSFQKVYGQSPSAIRK